MTASSAASLTFAQLAQTNLSRCTRWHSEGIDGWSVADWMMAVAGEAGEICNACKKLRRVEDDCANINDPGRQLSTKAEAVAAIGGELADTLIYLDLLARRLRMFLSAEMRSFADLAKRPPASDDETISDLACALVGKIGTLCEAVSIPVEVHRRPFVGSLLAEVIFHLEDLARRLGLSLEAEVIAKFNATSQRYGFPERLVREAA
jgi:NTP pyrophosphatase (non-canonical NTP hydrolase)